MEEQRLGYRERRTTQGLSGARTYGGGGFLSTTASRRRIVTSIVNDALRRTASLSACLSVPGNDEYGLAKHWLGPIGLGWTDT